MAVGVWDDTPPYSQRCVNGRTFVIIMSLSRMWTVTDNGPVRKTNTKRGARRHGRSTTNGGMNISQCAWVEKVDKAVTGKSVERYRV